MAMTVMMIKRTVTRVKEMVRLKTRPMKPSTAGARRMPNVADGTDCGDGIGDGHFFLRPQEGVKNGNRVGAADTDEDV